MASPLVASQSAPAGATTQEASAHGQQQAEQGGKDAGTESLNVPSEIGNLSLDEVVNKWTEDVSELSDQFEKAVSLVTKWDRAILANEDRIHAVHKDAQALQIAHKELSNNLDVILSQQSELHNLLDALEEDVERKLGASKTKGGDAARGAGGGDGRAAASAGGFAIRGGSVGGGAGGGSGGVHGGGVNGGGARVPGEVERESMHRLAADVMEELDAIALTVRDLVSELNKGRDGASPNGGADIVAQIIAVLNAHLDSLMYLDESSSALQKRLTDVSRAVDVISRESDRFFGASRRPGGIY